MPEPHVCIHFGTCGGCTFQNLAPADYRALKRHTVVRALERHGLGNADVAEVAAVAPATRRRAVFKLAKRGGGVLIGFHAARSHAIVDMRECLVLTPEVFALAGGLRRMMAAILREGEGAEAHVTRSDNGLDVALRWKRKFDPNIAAEIARWMSRLDLARMTANGELLAEAARPLVRLGRAEVAIPPDCFLQPTREGEHMLQAFVRDALAGAKYLADLFCGAGTFAFPLAERARVHAVDADPAMLDALGAAARKTAGLKPVTTERRDLFRQPLTAGELGAFDGVVLDPPRAGALAQVRALAQSDVPRVAYVSCNSESFGRDARILSDGGFRMGTVRPVDQFLWSEHIELVAVFTRR